MKSTTATIKERNRQLLVNALKKVDKTTKIDLSKTTGLSVATCSNLLKELIEEDSVVELPLADSTGGRPSRQFKYNANHEYTGCVQVNDHPFNPSISYSVFNAIGEIVKTESLSFSNLSLQDIEHVTELILASYSKVTSLCYGIPGQVDQGIIVSSDFAFLEGIDIVKFMTDKYEKSVYVETNLHSATLGICHKFDDTKSKTICYLDYSEEDYPRGSFLIDGNHLINGNSSFAGSLAYMIVSNDDPVVMIAQHITNICCILDPDLILLSGERIDRLTYDLVLDEVQAALPPSNVPTILFEQDVQPYQHQGLLMLVPSH